MGTFWPCPHCIMGSRTPAPSESVSYTLGISKIAKFANFARLYFPYFAAIRNLTNFTVIFLAAMIYFSLKQNLTYPNCQLNIWNSNLIRAIVSCSPGRSVPALSPACKKYVPLHRKSASLNHSKKLIMSRIMYARSWYTVYFKLCFSNWWWNERFTGTNESTDWKYLLNVNKF